MIVGHDLCSNCLRAKSILIGIQTVFDDTGRYICKCFLRFAALYIYALCAGAAAHRHYNRKIIILRHSIWFNPSYALNRILLPVRCNKLGDFPLNISRGHSI